MVNRNYQAGVRVEKSIANILRGKGYCVIESRGSHGIFDLACFAPTDSFHYPKKPLGIECKKSKKLVTKSVIDNLKTHAPKWDCIALVAYRLSRGKFRIEDLEGVEMVF